jgi:hypothetical protein
MTVPLVAWRLIQSMLSMPVFPMSLPSATMLHMTTDSLAATRSYQEIPGHLEIRQPAAERVDVIEPQRLQVELFSAKDRP